MCKFKTYITAGKQKVLIVSYYLYFVTPARMLPVRFLSRVRNLQNNALLRVG